VTTAVEFVAALNRQDKGASREEGCVSVPIKGLIWTETKPNKYVLEFKSADDAERWHEYSLISVRGDQVVQLFIPLKWKKTAFVVRLQKSSAPRSKTWSLPG